MSLATIIFRGLRVEGKGLVALSRGRPLWHSTTRGIPLSAVTRPLTSTAFDWPLSHKTSILGQGAGMGRSGFGVVGPRSATFSTTETSLSKGPPATSLAEEILRAKTTEDESKKEGAKEQAEKPGPKPMTKWQKFGYIFFGVSMVGAIAVNAILFALPDRDENGQIIEDEYSSLPFYSQYYQRLRGRFFKTKKDLEEPFSDKLLPDPLPEPYHQPKYTILLELTGLLVHSNWTHKHGWRFQKRPGVDIFLSQIGYPNFELVVYTVENAMTFYPIVDGLDPNSQYIMYRLFRDATRYVHGHHTKDLSALNRDPRKVIMIDWNENSVLLNKENALLLQKWEGDNADRTLIGLAQLLQAIKQSDVEDVRDVLEYYRQFNDPIEAFRENQRRLQTEMEAEEKRKEQQIKKPSFFSGFTGLGRQRT